MADTPDSIHRLALPDDPGVALAAPEDALEVLAQADHPAPTLANDAVTVAGFVDPVHARTVRAVAGRSGAGVATAGDPDPGAVAETDHADLAAFGPPLDSRAQLGAGPNPRHRPAGRAQGVVGVAERDHPAAGLRLSQHPEGSDANAMHTVSGIAVTRHRVPRGGVRGRDGSDLRNARVCIYRTCHVRPSRTRTDESEPAKRHRELQTPHADTLRACCHPPKEFRAGEGAAPSL